MPPIHLIFYYFPVDNFECFLSVLGYLSLLFSNVLAYYSFPFYTIELELFFSSLYCILINTLFLCAYNMFRSTICTFFLTIHSIFNQYGHFISRMHENIYPHLTFSHSVHTHFYHCFGICFCIGRV